MLTTLRVGGMTCNGCVRHVREALRGVPGVTAVDVHLEAGEARIQHDAETTAVESLISAVTAAGYTADPVTLTGPRP
ncbi:MAG: heavy metal-associated domain-containing protein [Kofleriaceae bacterium]|nr:heavy metal-associated domain-containing protein [Kofleriaceae bacterium]